MRALRYCSLVFACTAAGPAFAHGGHAHAVEPPGWTWDSQITVPLLLSAAIFAGGWWRLHARSARGAMRLRLRGAAFALGWLMLASALVSPLHEAGERSFAAHMVEHELLMLVATPLLVLAEPLAIMLWAFPAGGRRVLGGLGGSAPVVRCWRRLSGPVTATVIQAAALWAWHAPALFDRALASDGWHFAQHLSFVVSALLFWTAMLGRRGGQAADAGTRALAALCLFVTSVVSGALGALMAFSESPWYAGYARLGLAPFGLTPAEDQQLAGLIMWVPGGLVHAAAALILVRTIVKPSRVRSLADAV